MPSGLDRFFPQNQMFRCDPNSQAPILKQLFHDVVGVVIKARANSVIVGLPNKKTIEYIMGYTIIKLPCRQQYSFHIALASMFEICYQTLACRSLR